MKKPVRSGRRLAAVLMVAFGLLWSGAPAGATLLDYYNQLSPSATIYWGFEEATGGAVDYAANGHTGTVSDTDPIRSQPGLDSLEGNVAFTFGGAGSVTSPETFAESNTSTQMAWIKTTSNTGGFIMGITKSSGAHDRMVWISNSGHIYAGVYDSITPYARLASPNTYNDGNWHLVTQTLGPSGWHLYVDSFEVASDLGLTIGESYAGNRSLSVGGFWNFNNNGNAWGNDEDPTGSRYFTGSIDDVVYFHSTQLSAAQIREAYNNGMTQQNNTEVRGVVDPQLTFSVTGRAGVCNGATPSVGTTSSATAVGFGSVDQTANRTAAQDLTVSSNAGSGWSVYLRSSGQMTNGGHSIANIGGTNASPVGFSSPGTEGFGYTTSDLSLGGGTAGRFFSGSSRWAALTTSNELVADESAPTSTTSCVGYSIGVAPTTPAGTYSTVVTYSVVPRF